MNRSSVRFRQLVQIQQPVKTADAVGERVPAWSTASEPYGDLSYKAGTEVANNVVLSVERWELVVRYDAVTAAVTPDWRVTCTALGKVFDIESVENAGLRNREIVMTLTEVK